MGLPGKPGGMTGAEVEKYYRDGHIRQIAEYCESDVLNTYRVWLRYELFRGRLSQCQSGQLWSARPVLLPCHLALMKRCSGKTLTVITGQLRASWYVSFRQLRTFRRMRLCARSAIARKRSLGIGWPHSQADSSLVGL